MEKREAKIVCTERDLTEEEQQIVADAIREVRQERRARELKEFNKAFDEAQAWAKSVGLTEQDVEYVIETVRQKKRQSQRQSA